MNIGSPSYRMIILSLCTMFAVSLSSCGFGLWTRSFFGAKASVKVTIAPNVNQTNPVQMDLLLVYDDALLKQLLQMTAKDWFEKRDEIRNNYPEGEGYDSWQWEWIPNQKVAPQYIPVRMKSLACIVFANYYTAGPHRMRVSPHEDMKINLSEKGFSVEPQ